MEKSIDRDIS
jgi:hypothetical protein